MTAKAEPLGSILVGATTGIGAEQKFGWESGGFRLARGRVKTCATRERAALFSLWPFSDSGRQCFSFFGLTISRRTFYAQLESWGFYTASPPKLPCPAAAVTGSCGPHANIRKAFGLSQSRFAKTFEKSGHRPGRVRDVTLDPRNRIFRMQFL